jgi:cytochrome c peroxidase
MNTSQRCLLFAVSAVAAVASVAKATAQGLPPVPVPAGNPITPDKVLLGKALFYEEQMSATHTVACATCHVHNQGGGSDPRVTAPGSVHPGFDGTFGTRDDVIGSRGVPGTEPDGHFRVTGFRLADQVTGRRSMPVINAAFAASLFWDGRAGGTFRDPLTQAVVLTSNAALESQAVGPPMSDVEMAHFGQTWPDVVARLQAVRPLALASNIPAALAQFLAGRSYGDLFQIAFGSPDVTPARIGMAIATYQRTLVSDQSPWDDFQRGNTNALTPQQNRGRQLFFSGLTECSDCHGGPLLAINQFFYTGVTPQNEDLGRFLVTNNNNDRGRMRAPTLRNVALRSHFFHNGSARTLRDVVDFYARGGNFNAPNKDPRVSGFNMSGADRDALVAFLGAFTDPRVAAGLPPFDRPTLYSEVNPGTQHYGWGTPGSGGITPALIASAPPHTGHRTFAVGIDRGHGGSPALLVLDGAGNSVGFSLFGVDLFLALSPATVLLPAVGMVGSGPGTGAASVVLPIPDLNHLRGVQVFAQWLVADAGNGAFAATGAVRLTLQ